MAKNAYIGIGNKAKYLLKIYVGITNKARKVKKIYIGIDGKSKLTGFTPSLGVTICATFKENSAYEISASVGSYAIFFGGRNIDYPRYGHSYTKSYNSNLVKTSSFNTSTIWEQTGTTTGVTEFNDCVIVAGGKTQSIIGTEKSNVVKISSSLLVSACSNLSSARESVTGLSNTNYAIMYGGIKWTYENSNWTFETTTNLECYNKSYTKSIVNSSYQISNATGSTVGNYAICAHGEYSKYTTTTTEIAINNNLVIQTGSWNTIDYCEELQAGKVTNYATFSNISSYGTENVQSTAVNSSLTRYRYARSPITYLFYTATNKPRIKYNNTINPFYSNLYDAGGKGYYISGTRLNDNLVWELYTSDVKMPYSAYGEYFEIPRTAHVGDYAIDICNPNNTASVGSMDAASQIHYPIALKIIKK